MRQAEVHLKKIKAAFGARQLGSVRPSEVRAWCASLADEGFAPSYVYAIHGRLVQLYADAIEDGYVARSPAGRKTSPPMGRQRPFVATTEQVWGLHDAVPENIRPAILLGAFVGLRTAEACGLRVRDVDFMRGVVHPTVQYPAEDLKTETSTTPVPIPQSLALDLAAHVKTLPESAEHLLVDQWQHQLTPWTLQRAVDKARRSHVQPVPAGHDNRCTGCLVAGLPPEFRFHDLRHYLASMLIASGADVKVVQKRLRHASAKTTLDTYAHMWPDADDTSRAAVEAAFTVRRVESLADNLRTIEES